MDRSITSSPEQFLEITPKKISRQRVGWGGGRAKHVFTFDPRLRRSCAGPGFKGGTPIANLASKVTTHLPRLGSGQNMALKHRKSTECLNKII